MEPFTRNDWLFRLKSTQRLFHSHSFAVSSLNSQLSVIAHHGLPKMAPFCKFGCVPEFNNILLNSQRPPFFFSSRCMNSIIYTFAWCQSSHLLPEKKRKVIFMLNQNVDKLPKVDIGLCFRLDVTLWAHWPVEQLWKRAALNNFGGYANDAPLCMF